MSEDARAQNDPSGEGLPSVGDQFQGARHSAEPTEAIALDGEDSEDDDVPS